MKASHRHLLAELPDGYSIGYPHVEGAGPSEPARTLGGHSGHPYVLKPDGTPLRGRNGIPIKVSSSPGRKRTVKYELVRIRKALRALEAVNRGTDA